MSVGSLSTIAEPKNPTNDFFGNVLSGISTGLEKIGSDVLPVWAASQLMEQKDDQLYRNMFDPEGTPAPVKIDASIASGEYGTQSFFNKVLFDLGAFQVTGGGMIVAAGVFVAAIVVLRKVV